MNAIVEQGQKAEHEFNSWLQNGRLSYVSICQSQETFSSLFPGNVKRPDFLLLLESIGFLAIDVKNYTLSRDTYTLGYEMELRRSLAFERLFRIPIWYAYFNEDRSCWYWISALKALERGEIRHNQSTSTGFLAIALEHFECITTASDLSKLYAHRLSSTDRINATAATA